MRGVKKQEKGWFEIQLLIIGILVPLYLNYLPLLITPITYYNISFDLPKIASYVLGGLWALCLIIGTYSLISAEDALKKVSRQWYDFLFMINNRVTVLMLIFIVTVYIKFFISALLVPFVKKNVEWVVPVVVLIIVGLIVLHIIKRKGGKKDEK